MLEQVADALRKKVGGFSWFVDITINHADNRIRLHVKSRRLALLSGYLKKHRNQVLYTFYGSPVEIHNGEIRQ